MASTRIQMALLLVLALVGPLAATASRIRSAKTSMLQSPRRDLLQAAPPPSGGIPALAAGQNPTLLTGDDTALLHCPDQTQLLFVGSSTVYPITYRQTVRYANPLLHAVALSTGTTLGFENFLAGGSDVATASRELRGSDYENVDCDPALVVNGTAIGPCQDRVPKGILIARDEIAIIVNPQATWVPDSITYEQVLQLFGNKALLSDIFPDAPRDAPFYFIPDALSGTRDFFVEVTGLNVTGIEGYVNDESIIDGVASNPAGVGFTGVAYVKAAADRVKVVAVDGINPTDEGETSSYKFTRPLLLYYDNFPLATNKYQIRSFICHVLDQSGQDNVEAAGYVRLPASDIDEQRNILQCPQAELGVGLSIQELVGTMRDMSYCQDAQRVVVIGSSTVYPISRAASHLYRTPVVVPLVRSTGSGIGFEDLIAGASQIGAASRAIQPADYEAFECDPALINATDPKNPRVLGECQGVLPRGYKIGEDTIVVIVNSANTYVTSSTSVTVEQLASLFINDGTWDQVFPGAPAEKPTYYIPDRTSGTHVYFEEVLGGSLNRDGYVEDADIIRGVAGDPNGLGFLPAAAFSATEAKVVPVENIDPTLPGADTAAYPFTRPLYYYVDETPSFGFKARDEFICFMLTDIGQNIVANVGYLRLDNTTRTEQNLQLGC